MKRWYEWLNLQKVGAYKCLECGNLSEDVSDEALYKCKSCGQVFTKPNSATGVNHQCPDCKAFGERISDYSCPECEEGPLFKTEAYKCSGHGGVPCYYDDEEIDDHLYEEHCLEVVGVLKEVAP
ncbi:MAG TPA: hypothetical protein VIY48_14800 [Candidatus Paceibacterota bacterium]